MSGLVIKLAPNERLLINGAIIENGHLDPQPERKRPPPEGRAAP